jgi:hypothetical protein
LYRQRPNKNEHLRKKLDVNQHIIEVHTLAIGLIYQKMQSILILDRDGGFGKNPLVPVDANDQ